MSLRILKGRHSDQRAHAELCKQSPYTKDFSNQLMFSGPEHYAKGWVRVGVFSRASQRPPVALTCVRHKIKEPVTVLYFLVVDEAHRREGLGHLMLEDMYEQSPHYRFSLNVMKENEPALRFYEAHGWVVDGESLGGAAWAMNIEVDK